MINFLIFAYTFLFLILTCNLQSSEYRAKLIKIIEKNDVGNKLSVPSVVFFNNTDQQLYIIDASKARCIIYNMSLFPFFSIGKGRGVIKPVDVTTNSEDFIYVLQSKEIGKRNFPIITVFSPSWFKVKDILINDFKKASEFYPKSVAVSRSQKIYIVGNGVKGVIVLNKNGNYIKTIEIKDSINKNSEKKLVNFSDIFIDESGRIYILSEEAGKTYVLSSKEKILFKAGTKGGTPGKLSRPRGIAVSSKQKLIFIVDYMRQIVQVLNYNGEYLFEFGGYGETPGFFNYPNDIAVDNTGNVYVSDMFNRRVQVFVIKKTP